MEKVDPEWWKFLFDEIYLTTDARSVCDQNLTSKEVDFLEKFLKPEKSWAILDLCGGHGRHSLELSRRGFRDLTVLDYSGVLIDVGKDMAQKEGLSTRFVKCDARYSDLPDNRFRVIIVMAGSFGYLIDENENRKILSQAFRLLMPGGLFLLDLPNRGYILNNFVPQSWHEANDDIVVCRQRNLDEDIIYCQELVISRTKGLIRDATYCAHLYSPEKITKMLKSAGFNSVTIQKDFVSHSKKMDYGLMTNRMIAVARKN
jgi:D-alanine-D-alanine ligase